MFKLIDKKIIAVYANYFFLTGSMNERRVSNTLLKIFKGTPDNFPYRVIMLIRPIDKPYISLDNKVEPQFVLISLHKESKYWIKTVFDITTAD